MSTSSSTNKVDVFVDWENIRHRLDDNFVERVSIKQVIDAVQNVVAEIGTLHHGRFYGDFTLRRDDAAAIEKKANLSFRHVLRSKGRDKTDIALICDMLEAIYIERNRDFDSLLLCAGDAHYCEPVRKATIKGVKIFICAVGLDVSADLTSLAPFYPIERYINPPLTQKIEVVNSLPGLSPKDIFYWSELVRIVESLEKKLPFVSLSYFMNSIMPSYQIGGPRGDDRFAFIEKAKEADIITREQVDNPKRPGYKMSVVRLNRENPIVKEILSRK